MGMITLAQASSTVPAFILPAFAEPSLTMSGGAESCSPVGVDPLVGEVVAAIQCSALKAPMAERWRIWRLTAVVTRRF
ncbi:hypothetical protein NKI82_32645 [Mesorhizobium sp. M0482]|uniref:hypothetical protein n=1 Tax=Mesorhizobium sp. M0482 TaxID=2956948 RepID=UPI0033362E5B